jgi:hypothetical protein
MAVDEPTTRASSAPKTPCAKAPRKRSASAERTADKLAETRVLLQHQPAPTKDEIIYMHAAMCMMGLPRSSQKERVWTSTNGAYSMRLSAGAVMTAPGQWTELPLPQGVYARLVLADISTYAVRHKTRQVALESSASAYMRRLGLFVNGGKRGTYTGFKREALALAAADVKIARHSGEVVLGGGGTTLQWNAPPIEAFHAWKVDDGGQQALWPGELLLSEKFYESLREHAVPLDMRAYLPLAHSALAMDIYTWLAHRLYDLKQPLRLTAAQLHNQFGGYAEVKASWKNFQKRLREVQKAYPQLKVSVSPGRRGVEGGALTLYPSPPPVPLAPRTVVHAALGQEAPKESDKLYSELNEQRAKLADMAPEHPGRAKVEAKVSALETRLQKREERAQRQRERQERIAQRLAVIAHRQGGKTLRLVRD